MWVPRNKNNNITSASYAYIIKSLMHLPPAVGTRCRMRRILIRFLFSSYVLKVIRHSGEPRVRRAVGEKKINKKALKQLV